MNHFYLPVSLFRLFLFLLVFCSRSFATPGSESAQLDSLKQLLKVSQQDTARAKILLQIGKQSLTIDGLDSARKYGQKGFELATATNNKSIIRFAHQMMISIAARGGEYQAAIRHGHAILDFLIQEGDDYKTCVTYLNLSTMYNNLSKPDSALYYAIRAQEVAESACLYNLEAGALKIIGMTKRVQGENDEAIKKLERMMDLASEHNLGRELRQALFWLSITHQEAGQLDLAERYAKQGIELMEREGGHPMLFARAYIGLAEVMAGQEKTDSAIYYARTGLQKVNRYQMWQLKGNMLERLTSYFLKTGKQDSALVYSQKLVRFADTQEDLTLKSQSRLHQATALAGTGNYQAAWETAIEHRVLRDSLFRQQRVAEVERMEAAFETKEKDKELELMGVKEELAQRKIDESQKQILYLVLALGAFALFGLIIIIALLRIRKAKAQVEKTNRELDEAKNELLVLNQTKDRFFGIIAHDLRGSTTTFQGLGEMLEKIVERQDMPRFRRIARQMDQDARQLNIMLDNLLSWAFSQLKKVPYNPRIIQVEALAEEVVESQQATAQAKGIELKTQIPAQTYAFADPDAVKLVFRNLIANAIKFTESEGKIEVLAQVKDGQLEVMVSDTGVGMEPEQVKTLFGLESGSRQGTAGEKGSGLGLLLCKEFLQLNGGNIEVESERNQGTTFTFTLPVAA